MDFLSKINANAGIDVKKGQFVAENATVKNFEVSDSTNTSLSTTISVDRANFENSNFNVLATSGISIHEGDDTNFGEITICNGVVSITTKGDDSDVSEFGGKFNLSSYKSNINSDSYINMTTVSNTSSGAYIRISSPLDEENETDASKVEIYTSEFLIGSGSLKFNIESRFNEHTIESPTDLHLSACNILFANTNGVFIAFKDNAGCMSFTRNGITVSTIPEGETNANYGNVLLSKSLRSIERLTQSEYDAIETKDENTLYIIAG